MATDSSPVIITATRAPQSLREAWIALAGLSAVFLFEMLDNSILNVALPTIGRDLHASTTALQWVTGAYAVVRAVEVVPALLPYIVTETDLSIVHQTIELVGAKDETRYRFPADLKLPADGLDCGTLPSLQDRIPRSPWRPAVTDLLSAYQSRIRDEEAACRARAEALPAGALFP